MVLNKASVVVLLAVTFAAGFVARSVLTPSETLHAASDRVFELRTYTTPPGKLEALKSRFRDHTVQIFDKHGMTSIGYFVPMDEPAKDTLIYILAHPSREAAAKSWAEFRADPDWVKAKAESEKDGPLTTKVESVFMTPTDFSKIE